MGQGEAARCNICATMVPPSQLYRSGTERNRREVEVRLLATSVATMEAFLLTRSAVFF